MIFNISRICSLILLIYFGGFCEKRADLRVLFLGNSYTYQNNLPDLFKQLANSAGKNIDVDYNTPGGYSLEQHRSNENSLSKITSGNWDYVVLQEQSQIPTIDYYRYNSMYPAVIFLDSLIRSHGAGTAMFITWGRKNGGQQTINGHSSPLFRDYFHMQDSLTSAYYNIGLQVGGLLCPVGEAWRNARLQNPEVDLWTSDNSHPTLKGSYLAACVFYVSMFNQSPVGLSYTGGLTAGEAAFLQGIAGGMLMQLKQNAGKIQSISLNQNYPNPFNAMTQIRYYLPWRQQVKITIYDALGQMVQVILNKVQDTGAHSVAFNAGQLSSGFYYYQLQSGNYCEVKKMMLVK